MVKSKLKLLFSPSLTFILSTILVLRSRWGTRTTKKITTSAEQNDFNIEIPGATTSSCSSNIQLRLSEKFLSLWVLVYNGNGTDLGLKLANALSGNLSHTHPATPPPPPPPPHTHPLPIPRFCIAFLIGMIRAVCEFIIPRTRHN